MLIKSVFLFQNIINPKKSRPETFAKLGERDEVQGARRAEAEIVGGIQRGCEHRATKQFARADRFAGVP